ncbi:hypothetical protein SNEBB_006530 [Seison nebaliae]|nr:hypothetical protein SNEBB_006530 [Seison nebaliae]
MREEYWKVFVVYISHVIIDLKLCDNFIKGKLSLRMKRSIKYAYGVGHVANDLCAAMWFSYLVIYIHRVVQFSNKLSGNLMLLGQVADAISTPFFGIECDRTERGFCNYGRRKSWHMAGSICVLFSFPFIFVQIFSGSEYSSWALFIYYAPFVVLFQAGWATTQIAHLALIPELTECDGTRVEFSALRNGATLLCNVTMFGVTFLLLKFNRTASQSTELGPEDASSFRYASFICIALGLIFTAIFHIFVKEHQECIDEDVNGMINERLESDNESIEETRPLLFTKTVNQCDIGWKDWTRKLVFYQIGLIYMSSRLIVNVTQVILPLYLTDTLLLSKTYIAIIPLVCYISGAITSFTMRPINRLIGRKVSMIVGLVISAASGIAFYYVKSKWQVFAPAILLGSGGAIILVVSLSMTADMIGNNTKNGAFVYGCMSFADKLANGLAISIIQYLNPCTKCCRKCAPFYQNVMTFFTISIAGFCLLVLVSIGKKTLLVNFNKDETNVNGQQIHRVIHPPPNPIDIERDNEECSSEHIKIHDPFNNDDECRYRSPHYSGMFTLAVSPDLGYMADVKEKDFSKFHE